MGPPFCFCVYVAVRPKQKNQRPSVSLKLWRDVTEHVSFDSKNEMNQVLEVYYVSIIVLCDILGKMLVWEEMLTERMEFTGGSNPIGP